MNRLLGDKDAAELRLRREQMARFPFCPDHRDKVFGLECRECEIERLRSALNALHTACKEARWPLISEQMLPMVLARRALTPNAAAQVPDSRSEAGHLGAAGCMAQEKK